MANNKTPSARRRVDLKPLDEDQTIEGIYNKIEYVKLLQHAIARSFLERGQNRLLRISAGTVNDENLSGLVVEDLTDFSARTKRSIRSILSRSQLDSCVRARARYEERLKERTRDRPEPILSMPRDMFEDSALTEFCDLHFSRVDRSFGFDAFRKQHKDISVSIGFHWISKDPITQKYFLVYYASSGYHLHSGVERLLQRLKEKHCHSLSNIEFILRLLFILSLWDFRDEEHSVDDFELLKLALTDLVSQYAPQELNTTRDQEIRKWTECLRKLDRYFTKDVPSFGSVLRCLLLSKQWLQNTQLGPYPLLLQTGEEILSDDFKIASLSGEGLDQYDYWNFSVVASIEGFFLDNAWATKYGFRKTPFKTFLVAKPIYFRSALLGDVFAAGTYLPRDRDCIREHLLGISSRRRSRTEGKIQSYFRLVRKEAEYLTKSILTQKIFMRVAESDDFYSEVLSQQIREEFGIELEEDEILQSLLRTFQPAQTRIRERVLAHARKAAVAAVMSRNMSHNIGSHVLAALVQSTPTNPNALKILFDYLKHRQEFIADVSTASAHIAINRYLYQDVISKLIPACVAERYGGGGNFYNTLTASARHSECYPHLLLDHISGKSDIKDVDIKLKAIRYNEQVLNINFSGNFDQRIVSNDVPISLPNDILGCHALYVILENIIRNACKHAIIKSGDNHANGYLEFTITVADAKDGNHYRVTLCDNLGSRNINERSKSGFLRGLQKHITDSILEENKLRDGGWGFLEMKICAAYLIRYPLEEIDRVDGKQQNVTLNNRVFPQLLEVGFYDDDGNKSDNGEHFNLGFSIHLLKPKVAHVVDLTKDDGVVNALDTEEFRKIGVHTGKPERFETDGTDHEFLVLLGNHPDASAIESKTNQRTISLSSQSLDEWPKDIDGVKARLYTHYSDGNNIKEPIFAGENKGPNGGQDLTGYILLDDHGVWGTQPGNKARVKNCFYEPYGSQSLTKTLFVELYTSETTPEIRKTIMKYEINEAAQTHIILLDERIQSAAADLNAVKYNSVTIKRIEVLNSTGVYIPLPKSDSSSMAADVVDLWVNNLDIEKTIKFINNTLKKHPVEYLVIHLGILEKLAGSTEPTAIRKWIESHVDNNGKCWLDDDNKDKPFKVVVTSGRGSPSNLPDDVLYAPVSLVYQYVISYPSKILLTKLLKSIRKHRKVKSHGEAPDLHKQ